MADRDQPTLPDYGGACIDQVVAAALRTGRYAGPAPAPAWLPAPVVGASQVVLLVLDGLGWEQLKARPGLAPTMNAMAGGPITTVAPSTTAAALTSITIGAPPAVHGVVGYRVRVKGDSILNILRWKTAAGDARESVPPEQFQVLEPFAATKAPVITRADVAESGFTRAHMAGARMYGWRVASTIVATVDALLGDGERFVYAYYDGVDKVAHEFGFGPAYDAEVVAADRIVGDLIDVLPPEAALLVVSDHGQVDVGERVISLDPEVADLTAFLSGEGRFRWLHARPGAGERLAAAARRQHGPLGWVRTRQEAVEEGWFGGPLTEEVASRLGDVVIAPREHVAVLDPADPGEQWMRCRHGSLTPEEMLVPLLASRG
ncbi:MAG TPA: alkaline phosphatase family protein [Acidimicrobiales bacterium]|nr:alkaline phosphatase family protein [Acidimicrobiales bacterium]